MTAIPMSPARDTGVREKASTDRKPQETSTRDKGVETAPKKSRLDALLAKLPRTVVEDLRSRRTYKTWFRCMVTIFVSTIYLVVQDTLDVLGQAGFFALIVGVMLSPSMPLSLFIMAALMLVVGMCIGWAWSCAAMAAALRARSQTLLASQYTRAQSNIVSGATPDSQFRVFIFQGAFLDARSTVVFGVFFFIGIYALAALRAKAPKLTLLSIFGMIVMIVMCTYGPLFPSAQYTLATQFLIPTGFYLATAIACCVLIFPQSLNHAITDRYVKGFLRTSNEIMELQGSVLKANPNDEAEWSRYTAKLHELRGIAAATLIEISGQAGLMELEITRGRTGAGDLKRLIDKSKALLGRLMGVASFQLLVAQQSRQAATDSEGHGEHVKQGTRSKNLIEHIKAAEEERNQGLDSLMPLLEQSSSRLRSACTTSLADFTDYLHWQNHHRWKRGRTAFPAGESSGQGLQRRMQNLAELRSALAAFRAQDHLMILEPYRPFFDDKTGDFLQDHPALHRLEQGRPSLSLRSLFLCFVFATNLITYAGALADYLDAATLIEAANPHNRMQLPTAFSKAVIGNAFDQNPGSSNPLALSGDGDDRESGQHDETDSESSSTHHRKAAAEPKAERKTQSQERRRNLYRPHVDALPPRTGFQRFGRRLGSVWQWLASPEGLFALKAGVVSIALWLPSVFPNSAYFAYTNRSIWAQIMAVTGLGVLGGDLILGFIIRFGGTCIGLLLGMAGWYLGNIQSNGNAYGTTTVMVVFLAPFVFWKLLVPQAQAAFPLMVAVTTALIIGYSWVDTHLVTLSNPGVGVNVAWRRALLVLIGFTAAFIISLFPKPQTARKIVRQKASKTIEKLAEFYLDEMKGFIEESRTRDLGSADRDLEERASRYRSRFIQLIERFQAMEPLMVSASVEPSFMGPWPKKQYHALLETMKTILGELALLGNAWTRMQGKSAARLIESPFFDPAIIADTANVLSIAAHALTDDRPLLIHVSLAERLATVGLLTGNRNEGKSLYNVKLNWDSLQTEQLAVYATAIVALRSLTTSIDRLHDITRSLVGSRSSSTLDEHAEARAQRDVEIFGHA